MSLSDDHSSAKLALPSSVDKNDPVFSARFGTISGTLTSTILYHGNSDHVHAHRRLANTTALGLGLTGLFLAIGLIVAWYGYFRSIVNPDARSGFGRDPLRRNRGSHLSSNQQGEDFEYEREEDIDDGASPPGGGMRRASDSSGDEGWATQPPPPPAGLTNPEDRYRASAMTGGSDDIYDDTLGPKGSQRWDWVDRSNEEEEDYDDGDGEDRNDDDNGGRQPSTYTYKRQQQQNHTKANNDEITFSLPTPRPHKGKSSWRALSEKVVQKDNCGRNGDHKMLGPIQEDPGDAIPRPNNPSNGLNESIDGLLKKYEIGTSIKDGIQQGLGFLRRQPSSATKSSSNSKFPTTAGGFKDAAPQLPEFRNAKGGGYARSTATTSASSRSGPPMGEAGVEFSFDEESLGLESHSTTFILGGCAGDDMESVDWEAQATERMELARKKLSASSDIRRARSKVKSQAPIVIGQV